MQGDSCRHCSSRLSRTSQSKLDRNGNISYCSQPFSTLLIIIHYEFQKEFDRIRTKYGLSTPQNAEKIANLLADTGANEGVSAPKFAEMFGMSTTEAVVFLEWIKVGIKFKEETLDTAKRAGFGDK
ncbi:hypothetical protein ACHAXM_008203 [Skeletonema potamos]|jgi:hypothetical protein